MAIRQQPESTGSGSTDMKLTKFRAMVQDVDRFLAGRSGGVFMFASGASGKYKTYAAPQFKRYNSDPFISIMEGNFNPGKSSPLELVDENGVIQLFRDTRTKNGEKNFSEYYRLVFWLLFGAAVSDEIYNNELSNIVDFAYCLGFNEDLMRDWCKAVAYVLSGGRFEEVPNLQMITEQGKKFFLHTA